MGYSVYEIQRLEYRSAGERHEILCVQTLKLIIYMTWDEYDENILFYSDSNEWSILLIFTE